MAKSANKGEAKPRNPSQYLKFMASRRDPTPQERCRATAAQHGVEADRADDCVSGSIGCKDCPWHSGWSHNYLVAHGIAPKPAPHPTGTA